MGELIWDVPVDGTVSERKSCNYQNSFDAVLKDKEKLNNFNSKPGVYAIVLQEKAVNDFMVSEPIGFSYIDCSSFALEKGKISVLGLKIDKTLELDFTITVETPFVPPAEIITYEPLLVNVKR